MNRLELPLSFSIYSSDGALLRTETIDRDIIKIGTFATCHIQLEDKRAARVHAVIEVGEEETSIIDLGSEAGTIVGGRRVNKLALRPGDKILIGDTLVVVGLDAASEATHHHSGRSGGAPPPPPGPPTCPRCRGPLVPRVQAPVKVEHCQTCGGLWLDRATLRQVVELPGAAAAIRSIAEDAARRSPLGGAVGVFNVGCPVCDRLMERRTHRRTGIVIDLCPEHGTWFDRGEAKRMLERAGSAGGPFRSSPVAEEPTDQLPEHTAPTWMREGNAPPERRSPFLAQLVDLLLDLA